MSLTLQQVFEKAGREEIAYVHDGVFHYVVLTRKDNTFTADLINRFLAVLDQIEASEGPGVMVTIGTGAKHFSSGFDLKYWAAHYNNTTESTLRFQELMARLLEFPMPTMCVFNGNAIAAGCFLGLSHDFRIMHESIGSICLSELKLGMALPLPYMKVTAARLSAAVCNKLVFGITVDQAEALQNHIIDDTYGSAEQLQGKLAGFAKRYGALGAQRNAIRMNKQNQFEAAIQCCRAYTPPVAIDLRDREVHPKLAIMAAMMAKEKAKKKKAKAAAAATPRL